MCVWSLHVDSAHEGQHVFTDLFLNIFHCESHCSKKSTDLESKVNLSVVKYHVVVLR